MHKPTHREVKFSKEEMEYDLPENIDLSKSRFVGRGREGMEIAKRISKARGAEKRKLIESLPRFEESKTKSSTAPVHLDPDVAVVFKDSETVNKVLRALIDVMPSNQKKFRKTA